MELHSLHTSLVIHKRADSPKSKRREILARNSCFLPAQLRLNQDARSRPHPDEPDQRRLIAAFRTQQPRGRIDGFKSECPLA